MSLDRLGLRKWPSRSEWARSAAIAVAGFSAIGAVAAATGLGNWQPQALSVDLLIIAAFMFVVPSLIEELLFRGFLQAYLPRGTILSIVLFTLWHPLQHWTGIGPDWTQLFVTAPFLVCVTVAGLMFAAQRQLTNSIWPSVFSHWMLVAAWKFLFGGPF